MSIVDSIVFKKSNSFTEERSCAHISKVNLKRRTSKLFLAI